MTKKRFATRLISIFSFVVFGGFFLVYILFNQLMNNHIRSEAELALDQEMTAFSVPLIQNPVFPLIELNSGDFENIQIFRGNRVRSHQAIVTVDMILIDENQTILHPNPAFLTDFEAAQVQALADFWLQKQDDFSQSDEMVLVSHAGHSFYMRASSLSLMNFNTSETLTYNVLMYTDISPAMNLKEDMNQLLIVLLAASGFLTLASSILLSTHFKKAIRKLSAHATVIGTGAFNEELSNLGYSEFDDLAESMNHMAQMLAAYETKQQEFFQNASHELRTPLTSIQGYTEGIQAGIFPDPGIATSVILEESLKMKTLIDEILYLSKLGEIPETVTGTASLNEILEKAASRIYFEGLAVNIEVTGGLSIKADAGELERAVLNILVNAARHARHEVRIKASCDENIRILISNDGESIPEKDLPFLFDRFFKGENGNTGLGLAITKEIISKYGGTVSGINTNFGVMFEILLPL